MLLTFWYCRQYTSGLDLNLHSPQLFLMTPCIHTRGLNLIFLAKNIFYQWLHFRKLFKTLWIPLVETPITSESYKCLQQIVGFNKFVSLEKPDLKGLYYKIDK